MLFNEPKLLKFRLCDCACHRRDAVSVLFNEPKLLKFSALPAVLPGVGRFSALQRAEIAEIGRESSTSSIFTGFSALQRAEIAEIVVFRRRKGLRLVFQCSSTSRNC